MSSKLLVVFLAALSVAVLPGLVSGQTQQGDAAPVSSVAQVSPEAEPLPVGPPAVADTLQVVQLPPGVIALVNDQPITEKEWLDTCKRVAGPSILQVMINHVVVRQAAAARGIKMSDEEMQLAYDRAVTDAGGIDNLLAGLQESGESMEDFRNRLLTNALLRKLVEKDVTVTDDELRCVYLERYGRKAQVQVVAVQNQPDADRIVTMARKGEDFARLASENSLDEYTKQNHGYLPILLSDGFFPKPFGRVEITREIAEKLFALKPGEVSAPITAGDAGFYVFRVAEQKAASPVQFDTVKDELMKDARQAKSMRKGTESLENLIRQANIKVGIPLQ